MSHRYIQLPFAANALGPHDALEVVISNGRVSASVNLHTGESATVPGEYRAKHRDPASRLGGLVERVEETTDGPRTRLFDAGGRELASFMGELIEGTRTGDLFVALVAVPGPRNDVIACALGSGRGEVRLPGHFRCAVDTNASIGVALVPGYAHVFQLEGDKLLSVSVCVPDGSYPAAFIEGTDVWMLCTQTLIALHVPSLSFSSEHTPVALSCEAVVAAARGDSQPAVVAFVLPGKLLLDHPRMGRLTVTRTPNDPVVARGESIRLDDVREELPGIFRVHAWGKAGSHASLRPPAPPLTLPAPDVGLLKPPVGTSAMANPGQYGPLHNAELLRAVAAQWGFRVPALLDSLLEIADADAPMRRWLSHVGFESIEVRSLCADWSADPCLVTFAGMGNGDEFSLYLYPPALAKGEEPVVVEYLHETNSVEFCARTFEAFLAAHLERWAADQSDIVPLIRQRLGFALRDASPGESPSWLPRSAGPTIEEARALEQKGEVLAAERAYLSVYVHQGPTFREARASLERLYEQLGWQGALANLRLATD